jgi:RES domain-containing protein
MDTIVYRIAKSQQRLQDLSGTGAFRNGGRWNSKGTYMLYASMNSSLAYLETLVHFNEPEMPPNLFIAAIQLTGSDGLIFELPDKQYPSPWQENGNTENKLLGDHWMNETKHLAVKVRSAINPSEFNYLLNPLFPDFHKKVSIVSVEALNIDSRLIKQFKS